MSKQFLHCSYVVTCFQKVRCEGMTKRVAGRRLGDPGLLHGPLDGALDTVGQQMVSDRLASVWRAAELPGWKDELPCPLLGRLRIFSAHRERR